MVGNDASVARYTSSMLAMFFSSVCFFSLEVVYCHEQNPSGNQDVRMGLSAKELAERAKRARRAREKLLKERLMARKHETQEARRLRLVKAQQRRERQRRW